MRLKAICLIFIIMVLVPKAASARDDFQYWSQYSFKLHDGENIDWVMFAEARIKEDANKTGLYFVSQRLTFDYFENLDFGLNYTYLNTRKTASADTDKEYKTHHRAEVEVNPHWNISGWLTVHVRNRAEFRWVEDLGSHNTRYRQRWTLTFPFKEAAPLKSLYTSGEFFYDIADHRLNQNRMVPLGADFKINEKTSFKLYYMVQSVKGARDWSSNQILGTLVSMKF